MKYVATFPLLCLFLSIALGSAVSVAKEPITDAIVVTAPKEDQAIPIAPAKSIASGLLLEPDLDLEWFTHEKFVEMVSNVGKHKIGKPWKKPYVTLPPHDRSEVKGLTEEEIKQYMFTVRDLSLIHI